MLFQIFPSPCRCKNLLKITSNLLENLYLDRFMICGEAARIYFFRFAREKNKFLIPPLCVLCASVVNPFPPIVPVPALYIFRISSFLVSVI